MPIEKREIQVEIDKGLHYKNVPEMNANNESVNTIQESATDTLPKSQFIIPNSIG